MKRQYLKKAILPSCPGVYVFRDSKKRPLYIGRASSLVDRVKSYFAPDLIITRGPRIVDMITKAKHITFHKTDSVLEAIILESALIKKYQPLHNIDERDDKSDQYVVISDEEWPRVFQVRARDHNFAVKTGTLSYKVMKVFGPYPEGELIKDALKILRKLFPFKDKKSHDLRHDAFYKTIKMSPDSLIEYGKTIRYLIRFFEGKKNLLRSSLKREMDTYSRRMEFEKANRAKKLLFSLNHIQDVALIKREKSFLVAREFAKFRMEAYDIAHLCGVNVVGAMVVSVGGEFTRSEYRRFMISRQINNDIAALVEIIERRLDHSEWTYPDLIIVDGNEIHANAAEAVLSARRINIPVVAVTKDDKHKAARIVGSSEIIRNSRIDVIALNAEAHRFAIQYHRNLRNKFIVI